MNANHSHLHHYFDIWLAALILVAGFLPFVALDNHLMAATYSHNPYGSADSCALVNGNTVLYGWAYDPDTGGGSQPYVTVYAGTASAKVPSNIDGYRDSYVDNYVKTHNPGAPATGGYGWTWSIGGLTQGNSYTVKGTVLNYGAGTKDATLMVNTSSSGIGSRYPFTSTHTIPNACLAPKPTPPTAPTPSTTPTPSTPPTSPMSTTTKKSSGTTSTSTAKTTAPATPTAPPAPVASEITTTVGTTNAVLSLPASGATAITVHYGPNPDILTQTATSTGITGATAIITLRNLLPKATYDFTVSRTANNLTSTSPVIALTTKGYELKFRFVDGTGKPVAGMRGTIGKIEMTSGPQGFVTFSNMTAGGHALTFNYQGTKYSETLNTSEAKSTSDGQVSSAEKVIDLSNLRATAGVAPNHPSNKTPLVISAIIILLGGGLLVAWLFMRRQAYPALQSSSPYSDPLVMRKVSSPKTNPQDPLPAHAGQSLASMVMEAMQQERAAQQQPPEERQDNDPTDPPQLPPSVPPPMMPPPQG